MKNKALSTFMATAITASLVLPVSPANAASNDSSSNHSIQIDGQVAAAKAKGQTVTINNITKDKVLTSNGQFKISQSLKPLLSTSNSTALANAEATIVVQNGEITSITSLILSKAGTNNKAVYFDGGGEQIDGSLTVNADYVKVQNVNIKDELIVTSRVKKAITIDNVAIGDTITFKPLTGRKINWLNVSLKDIKSPNINSERTKVNVTSDKNISKVDVVGKVAAFEVNANVDKLTIDVEKDFSLYGEGKIDQVIVKHGAKVALDSGHLINKVQVDDNKASVTLPVVNKTELSNLVATPPYVAVSIYGYDVLTTEKWTTQAERTAFESAVSSAKVVANNSNASQEQVNNAITQYRNALAVYQAGQKNGTKYGYGDKSSLQSLINSVQYVTVSWDGYNVPYNTPWTTQGAKDALASAVSSAQTVVNNNYSTQNDIVNATNNLNNAISTYKNAYKYGSNGNYGDKTSLQSLINSVQYVTISSDGYNVPYNTPWTTQAEYNALYSTVSSAQTVVNNNYSTQNDITNATNNLNNAISIYKNAYKYGTNGNYADKSQLTNLINSVTYVTVSWTNGRDVAVNSEPWTTQTEKDTLASAVSSAQSVVNNYYVTQNDVANAINSLNAAITNYKNSYKYGWYY
ncbi:S-layer protein [Lysinibacillus sp. NPDC094403]|uniref:S-layer protein n=1 Tax=Lysinibacillus sp. NPDC094403 TaxID=3390581 RepID=UPI003D064034